MKKPHAVALAIVDGMEAYLRELREVIMEQDANASEVSLSVGDKDVLHKLMFVHDVRGGGDYKFESWDSRTGTETAMTNCEVNYVLGAIARAVAADAHLDICTTLNKESEDGSV